MPLLSRIRRLLPIAILLLVFTIPGRAESTGEDGIRESILSGTWYPGDADELRRTVRGYLDGVQQEPLEAAPIALIAPHAGYAYSGPVAAHAYKLLETHPFKTVVIISPSHRGRFPGVSVYDRGGYRTPLGLVPLDTEFVERLKKAKPTLRCVPRAHAREHAIEIQLPFLQVAMPGFKLVPLVMGSQDLTTCNRLAAALVSAARDDSVLFIASTDLSHYHPYDDANKLDAVVHADVEALAPEKLHADLLADQCEACGAAAMVTVMLAARAVGADRARVLYHANSGDITGDKSKVVGYMAAALWNAKGKRIIQPVPSPPAGSSPAGGSRLSDEDRATLHQIAYDSVQAAVRGEASPPLGEISGPLEAPRGAFVTLTKHGNLRGCIGHVIGRLPLAETVRKVAAAAATKDPRFPPVSEEELDQLEIEISVMSPLREVKSYAEIEVGLHGILMRRGFHSGLLLPQVATQYGWDRQAFLEHTCRKAGLPEDCWKDSTTSIYVFSAEVF